MCLETWSRHPAGDEDLSFAAGPRQYLASIYWATTTIATIGYGAQETPYHLHVMSVHVDNCGHQNLRSHVVTTNCLYTADRMTKPCGHGLRSTRPL